MHQYFVIKNKHPQHPATYKNYGYHIQQNSHFYNIILTTKHKADAKKVYPE